MPLNSSYRRYTKALFHFILISSVNGIFTFLCLLHYLFIISFFIIILCHSLKALYALLDSDPTFSDALATFVEHIRNDKPYTPGGLVFLDPWGANRHAANVAYIALMVSSRTHADTHGKTCTRTHTHT